MTGTTAHLTIGARPITVTADPQTKVYGEGDPALTYQITSGSLAFSDDFTGGLARDTGEDVGTYAISQGDLALTGNYALTFIGDELTVTVRPITVTADPHDHGLRRGATRRCRPDRVRLVPGVQGETWPGSTWRARPTPTPAAYTDSWRSPTRTGNYNDTEGSVADQIDRSARSPSRPTP